MIANGLIGYTVVGMRQIGIVGGWALETVVIKAVIELEAIQ